MQSQYAKEKAASTKSGLSVELRIDRFLCFYLIEENNEVKVVAVGHKEHNVLFIRGRRLSYENHKLR